MPDRDRRWHRFGVRRCCCAGPGCRANSDERTGGGANRYVVSRDLINLQWPEGETGLAFADALSAAVLAAVDDVPLLSCGKRAFLALPLRCSVANKPTASTSLAAQLR